MLKVCWLGSYPLARLHDAGLVLGRKKKEHPSSWIVTLSGEMAGRRDLHIDLITLSQLVSRDQVIHCSPSFSIHVLRNAIPFTCRGCPSWLPLSVMSGFRHAAHRLAGKIRSINPDILHAFGTEDAYALGALQVPNTPAMLSLQGIITEIAGVDPQFRFRRVIRWEQYAVSRFSCFSCRNHFDTGFVKRLNPGARIFQIPEAMNPVFYGCEWALSRAEPVIVYVGRPDRHKGFDVLLGAFARIADRLPAYRIRAVGLCRESVPEAVRLALNLGVEDRIDWVGRESTDELAITYCRGRVFVLPSRNENSPNALAEAMIVGLPVLASDVGGIPDMIDDGVTGFLFPSEDEAALAEKLLLLIRNDELSVLMGARARQAARPRHRPEHVAELTVNAYREILNSRDMRSNG